jgi:hypothetical protein
LFQRVAFLLSLNMCARKTDIVVGFVSNEKRSKTMPLEKERQRQSKNMGCLVALALLISPTRERGVCSKQNSATRRSGGKDVGFPLTARVAATNPKAPPLLNLGPPAHSGAGRRRRKADMAGGEQRRPFSGQRSQPCRRPGLCEVVWFWHVSSWRWRESISFAGVQQCVRETDTLREKHTTRCLPTNGSRGVARTPVVVVTGPERLGALAGWVGGDGCEHFWRGGPRAFVCALYTIPHSTQHSNRHTNKHSPPIYTCRGTDSAIF